MDVLTTIRSRREEISKTISALQAEDADLAVAEKVIARLAPVAGTDGPPVRHIDYVVQALAHMPGRWAQDWSHLQSVIKGLFGVDIPKSSLQPYLSHLKNDGTIVRDGARIALKARVAKGAGPHSDGSYDPATASADEDDTSSRATMEMRQREALEIQRVKELEAMRRRNIRNVNN